MNNVVSAQTSSERRVIESFDKEFARLHARSCRLIERNPVGILYEGSHSSGRDAVSLSAGEYVLKSAGIVEQTFGGITSNLWDDPFEWTLPETLSTTARLLDYLGEVENTRKHAFGCFSGDGDLLKTIAAPSGDMRPLINLLLDTLVRALGYQGRAIAMLTALSNARARGSII